MRVGWATLDITHRFFGSGSRCNEALCDLEFAVRVRNLKVVHKRVKHPHRCSSIFRFPSYTHSRIARMYIHLTGSVPKFSENE
jgi:hypothetical protein